MSGGAIDNYDGRVMRELALASKSEREASGERESGRGLRQTREQVRPSAGESEERGEAWLSKLKMKGGEGFFI